MRTTSLLVLLTAFAAALLIAASIAGPAKAGPYMIVGNDEKILWDDDGKPVLSPPGKDSVLIVDLANPEEPKIVANLPLKNSVVGPPVSLDIDPTGTIAIGNSTSNGISLDNAVNDTIGLDPSDH